MPAIERVIPIVGQISDPLREMLARRLRELAGLGVLTLACVVAAALMTWSVQDPSLSHATSGTIRNIIGRPGAIGADLLMQIFGLGSIMLVLPIAIWGWRLLTHRFFDREALRIACWILCAVVAAGLASCLPRSGAWPLPTGLGGVVGDALVRVPAVVFGPPGIIYRGILGLILFATMIASFLFASGAGSQEKTIERTRPPMIEEEEEDFADEDDDRRSVSLGAIVHAIMSAKARATRLFSSTFALLLGRNEDARARSFERMEPSLGSGRRSPSLVPEAENEDYEDHEEEEDEEEEEEDEAPVSRASRKRPEPKASTRKGVFVLPPISVLAAPKASDRLTLSKDELEENSRALEGVLQDFGVRGEIVKANPGPVVTLYELEPAPGIKSSRVIGLADDIARSMSAISARVAVVRWTQRHRHRTAECKTRESLPARTSDREGRH